MKAYKGFDKDLRCRGFQYEIGKTYECDEVMMCEKGFHACLSPINVYSYYVPGFRFCEVDIEDYIESADKLCGKRITILREFIPKEYVEECIKYAQTSEDEVHDQEEKHQTHVQTSRHREHAQTSGIGACAQTLGYRAHAQTSKYAAHAQTSGYQAHAQTSENNANAQTSTSYSHAQTSGDEAHAQTSGFGARAQTFGSCSHAQTSGYNSCAQTSGQNSIACSLGYDSVAMAGEGGWIGLVEYDDNFNVINAKFGKVGVDIEKNKLYKLVNNEFVEV